MIMNKLNKLTNKERVIKLREYFRDEFRYGFLHEDERTGMLIFHHLYSLFDDEQLEEHLQLFENLLDYYKEDLKNQFEYSFENYHKYFRQIDVFKDVFIRSNDEDKCSFIYKGFAPVSGHIDSIFWNMIYLDKHCIVYNLLKHLFIEEDF